MLQKHFVCWLPNNVRRVVHHSKFGWLMSALGQKQTLGLFRPKTLDRLDRDQKWSSKCGAPARGHAMLAIVLRDCLNRSLLSIEPLLIGAVRLAFRRTASRAVEATNGPAV